VVSGSRLRVLAAALAVLSFPCWADGDPYEGGSRQARPRPGPLPAIRVVTIGETGALAPTISGDETAQDCARFRPAEAQLRRYFRQARRVSFKAYTHDLDASRCYAAGQLTLADGSTAPWRVDREGRGLVTLPRRGNLYFHCAGCLGATP
jgi:hypothetical protein